MHKFSFIQDALGLLIAAKDEEGNSLSIEELKDQVLLLLFAGHETLTNAIASFCLLTAQHPDVLQKLRAEQDRLNITGTPTLEDLKNMTYLEQVIKEVMRLVPLGGGFKKAIATFEFGGYRIPEGCTVQYQIAQTHKDEDLYPESDRFDPDRFARMFRQRVCSSRNALVCLKNIAEIHLGTYPRSKLRIDYCAYSSSP